MNTVPGRDEDQSNLVTINIGLRDTRRSVFSIVDGLVTRGDKLEKLLEHGRELHAFSGRFNTAVRNRVGNRKFRLIIGLSALGVCLFSALIFVYCQYPFWRVS